VLPDQGYPTPQEMVTDENSATLLQNYWLWRGEIYYDYAFKATTELQILGCLQNELTQEDENGIMSWMNHVNINIFGKIPEKKSPGKHGNDSTIIYVL
jgi:hypothetical protein